MNKKNLTQVSVLIPLYNAELYILECLNSLKNQSYKDVKILICDDCSTDQSLNIVKKFTKNNNKIDFLVLSNKNNLGVAATRNKLIKAAKTKYIVWQDADDMSKPERIKKLLEYMENNPIIGMCGSNLEIFNEKKIISFRKYPTEDSKIRELIFRFVPLAQPAAIAKRNIYIKSGLFDESLRTGEDLDMLFRLGESTKFANISEALVMYRDHQSITSKRLGEMEKNTLNIRSKYKKSSSYNFSFKDWCFNTAHKFSLHLLPSSIKIKLFQLIRDK